VAATLEKVTAMGAKEYEPLTNYGEAGFITASVVDPFGNILGIMYNPHYLEILGSTKRKTRAHFVHTSIIQDVCSSDFSNLMLEIVSLCENRVISCGPVGIRFLHVIGFYR
jgi:hypothetical protein